MYQFSIVLFSVYLLYLYNLYNLYNLYILYICIIIFFKMSSIEPFFRKRVPANTDAPVRTALAGRRLRAVAQLS